MANDDGDSLRAQALHIGVVDGIRAAHAVAEIVHDLGDAAHADAADADEMDRADIERHARGRPRHHAAPPIRSTRSARRNAASGLPAAWAAAARFARSAGEEKAD